MYCFVGTVCRERGFCLWHWSVCRGAHAPSCRQQGGGNDCCQRYARQHIFCWHKARIRLCPSCQIGRGAFATNRPRSKPGRELQNTTSAPTSSTSHGNCKEHKKEQAPSLLRRFLPERRSFFQRPAPRPQRPDGRRPQRSCVPMVARRSQYFPVVSPPLLMRSAVMSQESNVKSTIMGSSPSKAPWPAGLRSVSRL